MSEKLKKGQTAPLETDIRKISIKLIDGFPNHPFYVFDDNEMSDLTESIRRNGLISPVIVRKKADRFELISGHRRKHACELLGHDEIACRIVEASDDEAIIMMVDSNCQRTKVLPSERAFAYKMKLEAMKRQGKRSDLTSAQVAQKLTRKTSRQIRYGCGMLDAGTRTAARPYEAAQEMAYRTFSEYDPPPQDVLQSEVRGGKPDIIPVFSRIRAALAVH